MDVETKEPAATTTHFHDFGYKAPHCGKFCQNLRETKSSQPAVLYHNFLTLLCYVCRNILSLKSERDEENWVKSCEADFKQL